MADKRAVLKPNDLHRHLGPFLPLLRQYPQMRVLIVHGMKPQIADHSPARFQAWADGMIRFADKGPLQFLGPHH